MSDTREQLQQLFRNVSELQAVLIDAAWAAETLRDPEITGGISGGLWLDLKTAYTNICAAAEDYDHAINRILRDPRLYTKP